MTTPNRIRPLRKLRGLSASDLAEKVGTSQVQISRLERGERNLTVEWMIRISKALDCMPEDLLGPIALAQFEESAEPYLSDNDQVSQALSDLNKFLYVTNSTALESIGIAPDQPILFDMSAAACEDLRTGDIVLIQLMDRDGSMHAKSLIRQFIAPDMLTTNRRGRNFSFHLSEESFTTQIKGVHRPTTHERRN